MNAIFRVNVKNVVTGIQRKNEHLEMKILKLGTQIGQCNGNISNLIDQIAVDGIILVKLASDLFNEIIYLYFQTDMHKSIMEFY